MARVHPASPDLIVAVVAKTKTVTHPRHSRKYLTSIGDSGVTANPGFKQTRISFPGAFHISRQSGDGLHNCIYTKARPS